jgi:cell division protein FtsW
MAKGSDSKEMASPDWALLGATVALLAMGLMMVYSSTFDMGYRLTGDPAQFFKRQAMWMVVGAIGMLIASQMHYRHWMKLSIPLMLLTLVTLIILAVMRQRLLFNGSVSPVEMAKLAVVIYIGHWLASKRAEQLRRLPVGLLPFTIIVGLVAGLVMAQPDISEALVIVFVSLTMFFLAGADLLQFVIGILGGGVAFVFVITRVSYAMERLEPFLTEWRDPFHSDNFQLIQGLIAIGSGGLFGLGPGNGRMKYQWLPAAHTDSIFAIIGEELGLVGALAIIGMFALLAYRGFYVAERATDPFGRLLATGITCWITLQALINMAVVTGVIPFTGIALPFISVGGSSLVTCMVSVGILLSISRVANAERSQVTARQQAAHQPQPSNPEVGTMV